MKFDHKIEGKYFPQAAKSLTQTEINARMRVLEMQKQELLRTVKKNFDARMRHLADQREELLKKEAEGKFK